MTNKVRTVFLSNLRVASGKIDPRRLKKIQAHLDKVRGIK